MQRVKLERTGYIIQRSLSQEVPKPVMITSNRKPIAAVIPLDGGDYESIALSLSPEFHKTIERSRRSIVEHGTISFEEMERRLSMLDEDESSSEGSA